MSTSSVTVSRRRAGWLFKVADYVELTKPKILLLVVIAVCAAGLVASWGQPNPLVLLNAMVGTGLVAASGSALNQWLEHGRDARMQRTVDRPLPAGRLTSRSVLGCGLLLGLSGFAYLLLLAGSGPALVALVTWTIYVWIYTPLKSRTSWNTAIGAVAGALPVLVGWTAVGGELNQRAAILFLVVYAWQFPHFMAIAWIYREQYADAGLKMLTVVDPTGRRAAVRSVAGALALLPLSFLPAFYNLPAAFPLIVLALLIGVVQLFCALDFMGRRDDRSAKRLLRASLLYLPALFLLLAWIPII